MPAPTALRRLGRRLFGGPLLRLPAAPTAEARRVRWAVGLSVAAHATLVAAGSFLTASALIRSGGSVAGVEIVLDTRSLATGPVADRSYAPAPDAALQAPEAEAPEQMPPQELEETAPEPPPQLAALEEPEPERLALETEPAPEQAPELLPTLADEAPARSLQAAAAPENLAPEPEPLPPSELTEAPPALAEPVPPADPSPTPPPPLLTTAPEPPPTPSPADRPVDVPPVLAQSPEMPAELLPAPQPAPPTGAAPTLPADPAPAPQPEVPQLAALDVPIASPEPPVVRSLQAPEPALPQAEPDQPPPEPEIADQPETAPEPPAEEPPMLAQPDEPAPAETPLEPEAPENGLAASRPVQPPRTDPRIIDRFTANALRTGRADGIDAEISAILSDISCGALDARIGEGGQLQVRGFLTSSTEKDSIRERLQMLNQVEGVNDGDVFVVGNSLCQGLGVYADGTAVLAPDAEPDPALPPELREAIEPLFGTVQGARRTFNGSNYLEIYVMTPDFPAHVYIDFFKPDGTVVHLSPSELSPDSYYPAPHTTIPISAMEPNGLSVPAGPPYGMGMVVTLSTSTPLFQPGSFRPREERADDYLHDLEVALRERELDQSFRSQYGYVFVEVVREGPPVSDAAPPVRSDPVVVDSPALY